MSAFEDLITVADERELRYLAQRLGEVQIEDPARRDSAIARNAPRVLVNGSEITTISGGTKVWGGPSHFNIFNFLGALTGRVNTYNRNQADLTFGSGLVNVDYVVDSNGFGDYLTLYGTSGALQAAIATGLSRTIWICTTHTETQSASEVVTLANNQVITILSAGGTPVFLSGVSETRPTITIGHANPVMTFSSASGSNSKIVMKGFHFYRTAANAGHFSNVTNGILMPAITCEEMAFDSNSILGSWGYFIDARTDATNSGQLGDIRWRDVTYLGLSNSASSVLSAIVSTNSHTQFAQHMNIEDSIFQLTNLVFIDAGSSDVEPAVEQSYLNNRMIIVQTTATDSGYGLRDLRTGNVNCRGFRFNDNTIIFKSAGAFYRTGIIAAAQDVEICNNYFNANLGGGTAATNFAQIRADAGIGVVNVNISDNTLIGPGSGTAINVESAFGVVASASQFGLNAFRNWGTNVGGTGAMTTIFGPVTFPGVVTGVTNALLDGVNHTDTLAGAVLRGDIIVGNSTPKWARVAKGAAGSVLYGDGTDSAWTINPLIAGYGRFGSASAPSNTTPGDLEVIRFLAGTGSAFSANGGSLAIFAQTITSPGAGANAMINAAMNLTPGADSSAEFRVLNFQNLVPSTEDHNFSGRFTGGYFEGVRPGGSGNYTSTSLGGVTGVTGVGAAYATGQDDAGAISEASGVVGLGFNRATVAFTTKQLTLGRGFFAPNPTAPNGLLLPTYVGLDIEALTRATANIGIRNASNSRQTGYAGFGAVTIPTNVVDGEVTASVRLYVPSISGSVTNAAGGTLELLSTTNATKGKIYLGAAHTTVYDEVNNRAAFGIDQTSGNTISGGTQTNRITIHQDTDFAAISLERHSSVGAGIQPSMAFFRSRGVAGAETAVLSGDSVGLVSFYAHDGTDYEVAATIQASVDGTPGSNDMPGRLMFSTTPDGAAAVVERMRLTNDGAMWIKGVAAPATPSSDYTAVYNETGTDLLKAKDDNGAVYNLTHKHHINVLVDGTVTNQKTVVGPMPQAGVITASKCKTCDAIAIGATAWIGNAYLIPAANVDTDGGTTTIYSAAPTITNGHMVSTNDTLTSTPLAFAAGDYIAFGTTQVGTSGTFVTMGLTVRYT